MSLQGTLVWLCSLAVWSSSAAQHESVSHNCSSETQLFERLKEALDCGENLLSTWSDQETASVLLVMRTLTETLQHQQLKACQGAEPKECPEAQVPLNGGLACVTVSNKHYCKPLCNHGYDFDFIRRSRLYEECSKETGYRWQTQYIGGNRLAVCSKSQLQVSGASTAYFPKDQDCLTTRSSSHLQSSVLQEFTSELKSRGVQEEPLQACLVCG